MFNTSGNQTLEDLIFILDDDTSYIEYEIGVRLWKYIPPFLLVFGTVGSILSIIVLQRPNLRKSVCTIYFSALAVSDLLVLYTGLLRQWIFTTSNTDIRHIGSLFCKFHTWILYFSLDFSVWIQVAVTVERLLAVWFPHSQKYRCSKHGAKVSLIVIACCLLVVNSHILYGLGDLTENINGTATVDKCTYLSKSYKIFFMKTWPWIYLAVFFLVPFCVLLIGNILIVVKAVIHRRVMRRHVVPSQTTPSSFSKLASMSLTLFTLNTVFLVCNIPISIYLIEYDYLREVLRGRSYAVLEMTWAIVNIMMYFNNAISFVLYVLSGTKFRHEFKTMILCCNAGHKDSKS